MLSLWDDTEMRLQQTWWHAKERELTVRAPDCFKHNDHCFNTVMLSISPVALYSAVSDRQDAMSVRRDIRLVCNQNNGVALFVQSVEQSHDLDAGLRVQVPGWFVGQNN